MAEAKTSRSLATCAALLVAGAAYLAGPPSPRAAASECAFHNGVRCAEVSGCIKLFCYSYSMYYSQSPSLKESTGG